MLKTKTLPAVIGAFISLTILTFAAAITMSDINSYIQLTIGISVYLAGVATLILSGKKDSNKLWCASIFLVAIGGTIALFAILSVIGFFCPLALITSTICCL